MDYRYNVTMDLTLHTPVRYIPRVGPVMAERLVKLEIRTVEDLLYHVPFRYDDFSLVSPIARVQHGETVTVAGTILSIVNLTTKSGRLMQQAIIHDETGKLTVIWFNQPFLLRLLLPGTTVRLAGKIDWFAGKIIMSSPSYEITQNVAKENTTAKYRESLHTGRLVPIYPETEGVSSKWLRGRIAEVINKVSSQLTEHLPDNVKHIHTLMDLPSAIAHVHFPSSKEEADDARRRLAFDELLLLQTRVHLFRQHWQEQKISYPIIIPSEDVKRFISSLPFELTDDQHNSLKEIYDDLLKPVPMNRLLVGDVGSGKTVVAAIAMYIAFRNGLQSVLMAPTQILAEQHYQTITNLLSPLGISIELVTSDTKSTTHKGKNRLASLFIGTHALLSGSVGFKKLGLVVIDEQHRFGVKQRAKLSENTIFAKTPHLLTMTATPIPRTVARILFGNLDLSVLNQMPKGRIRVKTWVVPNKKREAAYDWINKQMNQTGGQAFVVCPLIDESETLVTVKAVRSEYAKLKTIFPKHTIGLLHGQMKPKEKTSILNRFRTKKDAILLTTPVVEVGIDIPNAIIMLVEASDRFGLAQLHQLRGRVGRGNIGSYCLLFTESEDEATLTRLKSMETIFSGPELAEVDLKLRGPGKLLGIQQHGSAELAIASFSDTELIKQTQSALKNLLAEDETLDRFALLRQKAEKGTIGTIQD